MTEDSTNYTECPPLQKCVFQCSASREYATLDDEQDYNYYLGSTSVNFYYGVYYQADLISQGGVTYENFEFPFSGSSASTMSAYAGIASLLALFITF